MQLFEHLPWPLCTQQQSTVHLSGVSVYTLNDTFRVVIGCLRPTPLNNLPISAGIQPAELRRRQAMLSLGCWPLIPGHLLDHKLADPAKQPRRLKPRHPFVPAAKHFLGTIREQKIKVAQWVDHSWSAE